ncbi:MAG: purine-nucleoside phosphorylase, partial [Enterobacteriaceae bacterium]
MKKYSAYLAEEIIRKRLPDFKPKAALILGSGLGELADTMEDAVVFDYNDLPGFPVSGVVGHAGQLVAGTLQGVPVVCMKGRGHFYEGRGMQVMTSA